MSLIQNYDETLFLIVKKCIKNKDVHKVIKFFRSVNDTASVLMILHIPEGGDTNDCSRIVNAMQCHPGMITVFVPEVAVSTGSQIALSGDTLIMGKNACLSPFDDQLNDVAAKDLLKIRKALKNPKSKKNQDSLKNITMSLEDYSNAMESKTMLKLTEKEITLALEPKYQKKEIKRILDAFLYHKKYHACPLFVKDLRKIGVKVNTNVPEGLYDLFDLQYANVMEKDSTNEIEDHQDVSNNQ